jgi:hypothetical protein
VWTPNLSSPGILGLADVKHCCQRNPEGLGESRFCNLNRLTIEYDVTVSINIACAYIVCICFLHRVFKVLPMLTLLASNQRTRLRSKTRLPPYLLISTKLNKIYELTKFIKKKHVGVSVVPLFFSITLAISSE